MQKNNGNMIRLGLFITIALVLFTGLIYYIGKKQQMFSKTFRISAVFRDISGLEVGNNVRFSGINIGVIDNIEMIADTAVRVDLVLSSKTKKFIKIDSKASIGSDGLMGSKIVLILAGTPGEKEIQNHAQIATVSQASMDDIMGKLKVSLTNVSVISEDLVTIMGSIRSGEGTLGKLLMDNSIANNLDKTLVNIKEGTSGLKENMDAVGNSFLLRGYKKKKARKAQEALDKQKELNKKPVVEKKE